MDERKLPVARTIERRVRKTKISQSEIVASETDPRVAYGALPRRYNHPLRPNKIDILDDGSVRMHLSGGRFAYLDKVDYERLSGFRWYAQKHNKSRLAATCFTIADGRRVELFMHKMILDVGPGMVRDHINGDTLDNRRRNLREATLRHNAQNIHCRKYGSTAGASWNKSNGKWTARITINGKTKYLGSFDTEAEAAEVYRSACARIGETKIATPHGFIPTTQDGSGYCHLHPDAKRGEND